MALTGISEFTFGFAFLFEQANRNWNNLVAVPVLPSLQDEADKGWDAKLPTQGVDFYYQFKLSDYLTRSNAKYIKEGPYSSAYYRIALHKKAMNRQHRRLKEHSASNPNTFYVAPEVNDVDSFTQAYLNRRLSDLTRLIPLIACDDVNDDVQHYITFCEGLPNTRLHSDEHRPPFMSIIGKDLEKTYQASKKLWQPIDDAFVRTVFEKSRSLAHEAITGEYGEGLAATIQLLQVSPLDAPRNTVLQRTSEILGAVMGLTLVIVGTRPEET